MGKKKSKDFFRELADLVSETMATDIMIIRDREEKMLNPAVNRSGAVDALAQVVGEDTAKAIFSGDPLVDEKVREVLANDNAAEAIPVAQPWMAGRPLSEIEPYLKISMEPPRKKVDISTRITWDQYGMQLATTAALRADCRRRQVGAVLMAEDHSVISMGYNGGPSKGKSCLEGQCPRGLLSKEEVPGNSRYDEGLGTCVALHAEWNVLLRTSWDQFEGSTLYVTHKPCHICSVLISGTRIRRVVAPGYDWVSYA